MPVFKWFSIPDELGKLAERALSDPMRPEGLCIVPRTSRNLSDFTPHYTISAKFRAELVAARCALFMVGTDVDGLEIACVSGGLDKVRTCYVDRNQSTTIVALTVPGPFRVREHVVLHHSMLEYYPSKWSEKLKRRIKAPRDTELLFRFLKKLVKSVTEPGIEGQLLTATVRDRMENEGLLIARNGLYYDFQGRVRGTCRDVSGFSGGPAAEDA